MKSTLLVLCAMLLSMPMEWAADEAAPSDLAARAKSNLWDVTITKRRDDLIVEAPAVTVILLGQGVPYADGARLTGSWLVKGDAGTARTQFKDFEMTSTRRDNISSVTINGTAFEIRDEGKRLVVGDSSYAITGNPVIEIAADGRSKLRPGEEKK
jgi:hypothetical protein